MAEYYGKPVRTHRFFPEKVRPRGKERPPLCAVWQCGLPKDDPVHDHGE